MCADPFMELMNCYYSFWQVTSTKKRPNRWKCVRGIFLGFFLAGTGDNGHTNVGGVRMAARQKDLTKLKYEYKGIEHTISSQMGGVSAFCRA